MPGKLDSEFQFPSMFAVQMSVPFTKYQYRNLKFLHELNLQAKSYLQNVIIQDRNNIFHARRRGFQSEIFENRFSR